MTVSEYLKGLFDFKFSDGNIASVLARRGITSGNLTDVSEKDLDLATADLYMILANAASGGGKKVTKGNRSVSERSYSFTDKDRRGFKNAADNLYLKWGEIIERESPVQFVMIVDDRVLR